MESLFEYAEYVYSAPSAQLAFEIGLVLLLVWMLKRGPSSHDSARKMTESEKAKILADFEPEPLCGTIDKDHYALNPRLVSGRVGARVTINGNSLLNLATHNYLGLADRPDSTDKAIKALKIYGVGSCGPRGFYGTADVHLELEARLAEFMGVEEACLYSFGFAAMASVIPSYSKSHDVIFADEQVNFSIQQGIVASRSTVYYFKHNDPADLERLLRAQDERDRKNPKQAKTIRRFLILEGIYMNTGTLVKLPEMVKLRSKYKCRLFMDETISFGTMGKTGKGVREHFNVPNSEIDLMGSTLEHSISSFGGFLCGSHFLMEHQRLCGLGYCFSASLPPLQAVVTLSHLDIIKKNPQIISQLQSNCQRLHDLITGIEGLQLNSHPLSPLKHIFIKNVDDHGEAQQKIQQIITFAEDNGVALGCTRYLDEVELLQHLPSIKLTVSSLLKDEEVSEVVDVLRRACKSIL